jgi:hypothetical protein
MDDIYNMRKDIKRVNQGGLDPNEALLHDLTARNIYHKTLLSNDNRIKALFIAYDKSLKLAKYNQDVILLDCTYKTNKFDMPLFHIIGMCFIYNI